MRLTQEQLDRMLAQAHAEAPNECCGLLLGHGEVVEEVFPGRNADENPRTRYELHPEDALKAFREMDERGWELVGTYHSHPASVAYPSKTDQAKALPFYSDARYVIISLADPKHPHVRAFRIADKTDDHGNLARDERGQVLKEVMEEDVVVV